MFLELGLLAGAIFAASKVGGGGRSNSYKEYDDCNYNPWGEEDTASRRKDGRLDRRYTENKKTIEREANNPYSRGGGTDL